METISQRHNIYFAYNSYMFRLLHRSHHQAVHRIIKGKVWDVCKILAGKRLRERLLVKYRVEWEGNIKRNFIDVG
jgi:hypothetical protein